MSAIVGPIPPYSNPIIQPQFYQPGRFQITAISLGINTIVTTSTDHNYVIGQLVRLLVSSPYGSFQLNETQGYVIDVLSDTQIVIAIDSTQASPFIATPYTAVITNATQALECVVTANNSFGPNKLVSISGIVGMTELNGNNFFIISSTSTSFTLNLNSTTFGVYISGGTARLQTPVVNIPQIMAIGDINTGVVANNGRTLPSTAIPGSFINISPA
jgi:hypothetical protein